MHRRSGSGAAAVPTANEPPVDQLGAQIDFALTPHPTAKQGAPIVVVIDGPAVAKGRPRTTRRGFVCTPAHTRRYEAHARLAAQHAMGDRSPIVVPVKVQVSALALEIEAAP
jgi:hypothetical protein